MRIDVAAIDEEDFRIRGPQDGLYLINPRRSKHEWEEDELHLRSLLVREDSGEVVSSGFPKFFNYGEVPEHDYEFKKAFLSDRVRFTKKRDGSLIIVDTLDGKPHLRTRGSFDLGKFEEEVMEVAQQSEKLLPGLTNPHLAFAGMSLLFEYTGHQNPEDRIVLDYPEPKLTLIGAVNLANLEPVGDWKYLQLIAHHLNVPCVDPFSSREMSLGELVQSIRDMEDEEGIVASFRADDGTPRFLKFKSTWYLERHAFRSNLSKKRLRAISWVENLGTPAQLREYIEGLGLDFEVFEAMKQEFDAWIEEYDSWLDSVYESVLEHLATLRHCEDRKTAALKTKEIFGTPSTEFSMVMKLLDGRDMEALDIGVAKLVGVSATQLRKWRKDKDAFRNEMFGHYMKEEEAA